MIGPDDIESCARFAVGYRAVLADLSPAQRGVVLKAIADQTPGLAKHLCHDIRNRQIRALAEMSGKFSLNGKAMWVAEELNRYAIRHWISDSRDGIPSAAGEIRRLTFDILSANNGLTIQARQIFSILRDQSLR
ncbi:hypothetical protein [Tardiphaga sp.]|uniref:hypothetical protein n=1 Tax=Tardiphaga sp. TaxID=1926292 RepID=UPI00352B3F34